MVSHGFSPCGLRFKGLYFTSYQDVAGTKITFSQGDATNIKTKQFSEFGSLAINLLTIDSRKIRKEMIFCLLAFLLFVSIYDIFTVILI